MVFASLVFLYLFLPVNLVVYYASRSDAWRNAVLIVFSLFFYAWGEPVWIVLLLISAGVDHRLGLLIARHRGRRGAKLALLGSIAVNLGLLATFKYGALILESVGALTGLPLGSPSYHLPVGISFYTFQTMSYTIDVYRGRVAPQPSFARFLLFVSLFHQLVAGPIVRYADVEAQLDRRVVTAADFLRGTSRFCVGLAKKVCIANVAGELVVHYLDGPIGALTVVEAWLGLFLFGLQIYFDFSGYSDMAIGLGAMFGFRYPENFAHPFVSRSVGEFWRRWHITLGTFFREYVYLPLGGNRRRFVRNVLLVWGLTGLWHGAHWNYGLWGLYFGILIVAERRGLGRLLTACPRVVSHLYLLGVVTFGWVLFYFTDLSRGGAFALRALGLDGAPFVAGASWDLLADHGLWLVVALVACTPVVPVLARRLETVLDGGGARPAVEWAGTAVNLLLVLASTALLVGHTYNPFIYYRF